MFSQLQLHDSCLDTAWPGQDKRKVKPETPACSAPCAMGVNSSLSRSPALTSMASAGTKTTPREIQQWAADIWGSKKMHRWSTIP